MSFEEKRNQPIWQEIASKTYDVMARENEIFNKSTPHILLKNGIFMLLSDSQYSRMSRENKYNCIQQLGSLFGIDCAQSFNLANIILSQTLVTYNPRKNNPGKMLD